MTKTQQHQWLSTQLGMSPKTYVAWGLSLVRSQKELPTQVAGGGAPRGGSVTSLTPLPTKKTKRLRYLPSGEVFSICVSCEGYKNHLIDGKCEDCQ